MRLISNFKDYYDGVQVLGGHDDTLLYRRITETLSLAKYQGNTEAQQVEALVVAKIPKCDAKDDEFHLERVIVGVCGKLYLGVRHKVYIDGTYPAKYDIKYYYDSEILKKNFPDFTKKKTHRYSWWSSDKHDTYPQLGLFTDNCDDLFVRLGVPVFIIDAVAELGKNQWNNDVFNGLLIKNPSLKSFEFYKVLADYQIYQELEMYLGNVLVTRDEITVMTDKQKVSSHGFDPKYGFRTRKK